MERRTEQESGDEHINFREFDPAILKKIFSRDWRYRKHKAQGRMEGGKSPKHSELTFANGEETWLFIFYLNHHQEKVFLLHNGCTVFNMDGLDEVVVNHKSKQLQFISEPIETIRGGGTYTILDRGFTYTLHQAWYSQDHTAFIPHPFNRVTPREFESRLPG